MLEKIIVPIDSIEWDNTLNAVKTAMTISRGCDVRQEPELVFVHVLYEKSRISMSERKRLSETKRNKIEKEFEEIKEMCEDEGLKRCRTVLREGNPSTQIVRLAQEEDADLIAMGSGKLHDKSAAGRVHKFFYGSVTEEVVHEAPCSILVTRPEMGLERVLAPVDSIEWDNTMMGVENAIEFAGGCRGDKPELIFMHILHSPGGSDLSEERLKLERDRMKSEFDEIKEICAEKGVSNIDTLVVEGDTTKQRGVDEEIVEAAIERDVDMVVMGSGQLHDQSASGRVQKFVYGSVTEKVLHEAPCSILIARPLSSARSPG